MMTMMNKEQKANLKALDRLEKQHEKKIVNNYKKALNSLRKKIGLVYEKYDGDWVEMNKYNRLTKLEKEILDDLRVLYKENTSILDDGLHDAAEESFYRTSWSISNEVAGAIAFYFMDKDDIKNIVKNPYDRIGYKARYRGYVASTYNRIIDTLTDSLLHKESYRTTAKKIKEHMNMNANQALRIARTEMHRVRQEGNHESMKDAYNRGVNMKRMWMAVIDSRTRSTHGHADGQTVDLDEPFFVGGEELDYPGDPKGRPDNVIQCRCESLSIVDGFRPGFRRVRDVGIVKYATYEEFKAKGLIRDER